MFWGVLQCGCSGYLGVPFTEYEYELMGFRNFTRADKWALTSGTRVSKGREQNQLVIKMSPSLLKSLNSQTAIVFIPSRSLSVVSNNPHSKAIVFQTMYCGIDDFQVVLIMPFRARLSR